MKELVEQIAKALVTLPDQVSVTVTESESERSALYELRVAPPDLGRVIGKEGRTVNAIRTILNAAATRENRRVVLDIRE
ncbi:MAG TPA: KH domain-containing protein [Candidatus Methanoperedens sp.]|nr:KH domain-containing protein [Candidatus Methanoperedens sp.]